MKAIELSVGESFFIDEDNYRQVIFKVVEKNDEMEVLTAALDLSGLPEILRKLPYSLPVLRVYDQFTLKFFDSRKL